MNAKKALQGYDRIVLRQIAVTIGMNKLDSLKAAPTELIDFIMKKASTATETQVTKLKSLPVVEFAKIEDAFLNAGEKVTPITKNVAATELIVEEILPNKKVVGKAKKVVSPAPDLENLTIKLAHLGEQVSNGMEVIGKNLSVTIETMEALAAQQKFIMNALAIVVSAVFEPCNDITTLPILNELDGGTGPQTEE